MDLEKKKKNFKRIAESRVEKILDMLDLLGNLSNTSFYEFEDKDIEFIFQTLTDTVEKNKNRFKNNKKIKRRFKL
jgi:hypothetical protein